MIARRITSRGRRWPGRTLFVAVMIAGALAGCAGDEGLLAFLGEQPAAAAPDVVASDRATPSQIAAAGPVLAFVSGANDGQTTELDDPNFGGRVGVAIVRAYHAASDRACRRFVLRNGRGEASTRVACRDGPGWVVVPFAAP